MFRLIAIVAGAGLLFAVAPAMAWSRSGSATLCVGSKAGCYATIQAAVDAAQDGDTIKLGAGTFAGGVAIDKSVNLVGDGASQTVIKGGGPVMTVGQLFAASEPAVSISGVTVTGGSNSSSPTFPWFPEGVFAAGGGILVPPGADFGAGATLSISDSVISGNRVAPTATVPYGPPCPDGPCPLATASGGGIASWGPLTLANTIVRDNEAGGPLASDATGGGISVGFSQSLTMTNSVVSGNRATVVAPNGRSAEGGGIFGQNQVVLTLRDSAVSNNTASLSSSLPFFLSSGDTIDMNANGGGIHDSDDGAVRIDNTQISGNTISVNDPNGQPYVFDAGLAPGGRTRVVVSNSTISGNRAVANVGSSANVGPSGSALDIDGPGRISNTRITGNTTVVTASSDAYAAGAVFGGYGVDNGAVFGGDNATPPALIVDSVISGNSTRAISNTAAAKVFGAGILNNGLLALKDDLISDNSGSATGMSGFAEGGGIWNGSVIFAPPVQLTLENTNVTRNTLSASSGLTVQGGGLFSAFAITLTGSRIANNTPDQCYGC
jgi:hypothetical protein